MACAEAVPHVLFIGPVQQRSRAYAAVAQQIRNPCKLCTAEAPPTLNFTTVLRHRGRRSRAAAQPEVVVGKEPARGSAHAHVRHAA